jgi:hypothetical protein
MQRPRKNGKYSLKKTTFCPWLRWSVADRRIVNKGIISLTLKKCIAVLRRSCAITQHIVRRLHSPLHVKLLEAGRWGRSWCLWFLQVVRCVVVVCCEMAFCACSDFVTRCWCLARIWIKSTVCRVWYEHTLAFVWKSNSNFFSFNLSQYLFCPYVIWRADRERCSEFVK